MRLLDLEMRRIVYQNTTSPLAQLFSNLCFNQIHAIDSLSRSAVTKLVKSDQAHSVKGKSVGSDFDLVNIQVLRTSSHSARTRRPPGLLNFRARWTGIWLDGQRVIYILGICVTTCGTCGVLRRSLNPKVSRFAAPMLADY